MGMVFVLRMAVSPTDQTAISRARSGSRLSQGLPLLHNVRMRAAENAPRPRTCPRASSRRGAEIGERGAGVLQERPCVSPHPERGLVILPEDASATGIVLTHQRLDFFLWSVRDRR